MLASSRHWPCRCLVTPAILNDSSGKSRTRRSRLNGSQDRLPPRRLYRPVAAYQGEREGIPFSRMRPAIFVALLAVCGCAPAGRGVQLQEGDFALLEFGIRDCSANDQHVGLEKFLTRLYGTVPEIDLDRQVVRVRIPSPTFFDVARIVDGFRRANTGLDSVLITTWGTVSGNWFRIDGTDQTLRVEGTVSEDRVSKWRAVRVWSKGSPTPRSLAR